MQRYQSESDEVDALLQDCGEALAALHNIRVALKAKRNMHLSVNKLPVEVLRMIFVQCCLLGEPRSLHSSLEKSRVISGQHPTPHPGLAIATTCSYWRGITLDYPYMWSHIDMTHLPPSLGTLVLARAKGCPLTIKHQSPLINKYYHVTLPNALVFIAPKQHQIADLDVHIRTHRDFSILSSFFASSATQRSLILKRFSAIYDVPQSHIFETPLCGPKLQYLNLDEWRMPFSDGFYRGLTALRIVNCSQGEMSEKDEDIRCILRESPNLQELEISFYPRSWWRSRDLNRLIHGSPALPTRIPMQSLHSLRLSLPPRYIHYILASIHAPSLRSCALNLQMDDNDEALLIPALLNPELVPRSVFASKFTQFHVKEDGYHVHLFSNSDDTSSSYSLSWYSRPEDYEGTLSQVVHNIEAFYSPFVVRDLELDLEHLDHPFTAFAHLPSLVSLDLRGNSAEIVLLGILSEDVSKWPNLVRIEFAEDCSLTASTLRSLFKWCSKHPALCDVNLSYVKPVADAGDEIEVDEVEELIEEARKVGKVCWSMLE